MTLRAGVVLVLLLAACGTATEPASAVLTDAEEACVDFYRSVEASVEEEPGYMRLLAERIADAGHTDAAVILSDIADQWAVGTWEGDELTQLAQWAEVGALLGEAGELRCADISEWWLIDGYEGQPDRADTLDRQARIWEANALDDYYLLVAGKTGADERYTQIQVKVSNGEPVEEIHVETTTLESSQLPHTIDELYDLIDDTGADTEFFNLVHAYPHWTSMPDGSEYFVRLNVEVYPDALEYFDITEAGEEELG